jgi:hypothetical protein
VPARVLINFVDLLLNLFSAGLADLHLRLEVFTDSALVAFHFSNFAVDVIDLLAERCKPAAAGRILPIRANLEADTREELLDGRWSPTTEMPPPTAEISSSVQTFFGFFFSLVWSFPVFGSLGATVPAAAGGGCGAEGAGGWDCGAGLAEPESELDCVDCAGQFRVAKEARTLAE